MTLTLDMPFPPSVWKLYAGSGKFRRKSGEYTAWRDVAAITIRKQAGNKFLIGPWSLEILAWRPDNRRRDIDNIVKAISDTLVALHIVSDDSEMQSVTAKWVSGEGQGVRVHLFQHNERRGLSDGA